MHVGETADASTVASPFFFTGVLGLSEVCVSSSDAEFENFFLAHYESIVRSLTYITGDRERAIDATQEAFIKAYAKWGSVHRYDAPSAWVRRIAINASRDSHRSERRRRDRERPNVQPQVLSHDDDVVAHDAARSLLALLPRRQREVATLFYVDDLGITEISSILHLSDGTVKSHLSDARRQLRALVPDGFDR